MGGDDWKMKEARRFSEVFASEQPVATPIRSGSFPAMPGQGFAWPGKTTYFIFSLTSSRVKW